MTDSRKNDKSYIRLCACCGQTEVEPYDICDVCGWENDEIQNKDPDYKGGANPWSLNEAKEMLKKGYTLGGI